jgi:glycosyltransferase involved in cell wall biosynthesis
VFSVHIDTAQTWRGGQNQALLTVRGLLARGHRVLLAAHADGELRRRAEGLVPTVALAVRGEADFSAAWQLSRLLRQERPDVVHAHDPHGVAAAALACSMAALSPRPRLVASRRVDFHVRGNALSRLKYGQVDLFIAASGAIRQMLVADGVPRDRVVTVHEGVDVARVLAVPPASVHELFWLPPHVRIVGNVAALVPHKGHKYFLDAAPLVLERVPEARFLVLGEGELRAALEQQVHHLRLEKHVLLGGFRTDVLGLIRTFDVFVLSSVTEGLGTSLLDAMAASRPVVATRTGGIPEVVEDGVTGLLVPPRDSRALADGIVRLLGDEAARARMGAAGFLRVSRLFSADRMVDETAAAYERALGRTTGADTPAPPPPRT